VKFPSWFTFFVKSIALGVVISIMILVLVPDLRTGSNSTALEWFKGSDSVPEKLSYYKAVSNAAPAVVNIYSNSIDTRSSIYRRQPVESINLGSGVIMTQEGHILTCLHVIQNAESIFVGMQDGQFSEAEIVGQDRFTDLAVLKISAQNLPIIPQMEEPDIRIGDVVLAIGNPYNLGQTITQGIVSRTGRNYTGQYVSANSVDFIQTDAVLNEGNSGGALVDSNGYLIGINNANFKTLDSRRRQIDVNGVFFAIPYKLARRVMDDIISNGRASHGLLGFSGRQLNDPAGLLVEGVATGGAAEAGGLQTGDVILEINGEPVENVNTALDIAAHSVPGTVLPLAVMRDQQKIEILLTVAELEI
jgi:serine protease DegS